MGKPIWAGFLSAIVLAFICAGLYAFTERADVAKATLSDVSIIVGVDANPFNGGGNGTSVPRGAPETGANCLNSTDDDADTVVNDGCGLGTIDRCVSVNPNSTFYIDLFVKDVADLNKWDGALRFDGSIVKVTSLGVIDVQYLLAVASDSSVSPFYDSLPNSSGSWSVAAFDYGRKPESGSGVLARVGLQALNVVGTSRLYFTWASMVSGVTLQDEADAYIGDRDLDTYFDGLVFNAIVVVDGPCPTDADKDGFTNIEESVDGSDLLDPSGTPVELLSTPEMCDGEDNDKDGLVDGWYQPKMKMYSAEWYDRAPDNDIPDCTDAAADSDGDTTPNTDIAEIDDDNDGWVDTGPPVQGKASEDYLATDSLAACAVNEYHSAWPLDINNDRYVTVVGDVSNFTGLIGSGYGDGKFRKRLDLNADSYLTVVGDVAQFSGNIGHSCSLPP
jgi:hypothetical protein